MRFAVEGGAGAGSAVGLGGQRGARPAGPMGGDGGARHVGLEVVGERPIGDRPAEGSHVRVPRGGVLGEGSADDRRELRIDPPDRLEARDVPLDDGADLRERVGLVEGALAAQPLIEHDSEGPDIAARVDLVDLAARLLGGHVVGAADDGPVGRRAAPGGRGGHLGDPEVDDLGDARPLLIDDDDVLGLQVSMHDAPLVGGRERARDRQQQRDELRFRELAPAIEHLAQALAAQQLHDDEGVSELARAEIEDAHRRRVLQPRRRVGLALDTRGRIVRLQLAVDQLHRDVDVEGEVASPPDRAHAAFAHQLGQPVLLRDDVTDVVAKRSDLDHGRLAALVGSLRARRHSRCTIPAVARGVRWGRGWAGAPPSSSCRGARAGLRALRGSPRGW